MRTLLLTLGATPQVVTETLYALATRSHPFVPDDIHLITTLEGNRQAQLRLSVDGDNQLEKVCIELGVAKPAVTIHLIVDAQGHSMDDIRSIEDQDHAADQILAVVRNLTENLDRQLHVSLAGGRKTMGFYLAYALSLYGREHDELSHVLVNPPFESHQDFFYPPQTPRILSLRDGKTASTADARVILAPIPYIRLRGLLPDTLLTETCDYRDIVRRTQTCIIGQLNLHVEDRLVTFGDSRFILSDTQFVWLYWFAKRAQNNQDGIQVAEHCREEVMACAQALVGVTIEGTSLAQLTKSFDGNSIVGDAIRVQVSRLNKKLAAQLGPRTAVRITKEGHHSRSRYRLALAAENIHIHR